ncbi:MAG: glycosyl hydrolase-related protein, partial [candidate division KSB1 bacterium]|nr:glycosyl hydrolase-related protein [candidate division KSB1 bacterium]
VALLKDTHYGHYVEENLLDINLLRSPSLPDPTADRCQHRFRYSILPHAADPQNSGVIRAAYEFNRPLRYLQASTGNDGKLPPEQALITIDVENVILETVKKAEDGDGIILRLYEAFGWHQRAAIRLHFPVVAAFRTNLLEEMIEPMEVSSSTINLTCKPFEIITIRLRQASV